MPNLRVPIALISSLALGTGLPCASLALDYDEARALTASVRSKAREARASGNVATLAALEPELGRAIGECAVGPEGAPCRALVRFTLGTVLEFRAAADTPERKRWLGEAITQYEAILAEAPDHVPTLQALSTAHAQLGDFARAETVLVDATRRFPAHDGLAMLLGDYYWQAKRWDDALGAFGRAAAYNSTAELPRRRMVQCHVSLLPQKLAEFRKLLRDLEPAFPATAEGGYREIIIRLQPSDPPTAEAALLRLVSVLSGVRRLTPASLDGLPATWSPVVELKRYLQAPDREPVTTWWRGPLERRHALAEAALALGHQTVLEGDARGAAVRWEVGRRIAPEYDDYVGRLRGFPIVRLDLQTALALHYFKFPSLDPGERKFKDVVQDLFRSKAGAYVADDIVSIQRHHIVLGTIFAQKTVWGRPGQVDGALFQLDNALKAAARRDSRDGTLQPLPEVRAMLADALQATGDITRARLVAIDAAQAYLDTDGLSEAGRVLKKASGLTRGGQPPAQQGRIAQLQTILDTREAIGAASGLKLDPTSREYEFKTDSRHAWLFGTALSDVERAFLDRQRFKGLADLADRARAQGRSGLADELALGAFRTAVQNVQFLIGPNDLVRIERVRKQATQQKIVAFKPLALDRSRLAASATPAKSWILTETSAGPPTYVRIEREDLLAAQIVAELRQEPAGERSDFRVSGNQVVVPSGDKAEATSQRIRSLPGVGDVVVKPSLPTSIPRK